MGKFKVLKPIQVDRKTITEGIIDLSGDQKDLVDLGYLEPVRGGGDESKKDGGKSNVKKK